MLIFVFLGVVHGLALPARRTASGWNTTSTSAVAVPTITAPATIPSTWIPVPNSIDWPCEFRTDRTPGCVETGWATDEEPPNLYHTKDNPFIDPYWDWNATGAQYKYDLSCGSSWATALLEWFTTASRTYIPISASEVWEIVTEATETTKSSSYEYGTFRSTEEWPNYVSGHSGATNEPGQVVHEAIGPTKTITHTFTSTIVGVTSLLSTRSAHSDAYFVSGFTYTAAAPCCSSCFVYGETVQVFQWPTPAPTPAVSTLVDEKNNFTFISPSVYVAFTSIYAKNLCGTIGEIDITTLAFSQNELSTSKAYTYSSTSNLWNMPILPYGFIQATWGTVATCTPVTQTFYQNPPETPGYAPMYTDVSDAERWAATETDMWNNQGTEEPFSKQTEVPMVGTYTVTYNPCSPYLSVPTSLYSLQPKWTGCGEGISAFFDPPYVLTTGGAFGLVSATGTGVAMPVVTSSQSQSPVDPGATPRPATPMITPHPAATPKPGDGSNSGGNADGWNLGNGSGGDEEDPADPQAAAYIIAGQTLSAGGPAITLSSTGVSLLPGGSSIVVGGTKTVPLAVFLQSQLPTAGSGSGSNSGSGSGSEAGAGGGGGGIGYIFGSQTLKPGSAVTVGGTMLSLASDGASVVVVQPPATSSRGGSKSGSGSQTGSATGGVTKTEGVSVLLPGVTKTGANLQQTGGSANSNLTFTGGVSGRNRKWENEIWMLGALLSIGVCFVGVL